MQDQTQMVSKTLMASVMALGILVTNCAQQKQTQPPPPVPEVLTTTIEPEEILLESELPGRTSPYRIAEIRPQVSGLIKERQFTEGADVEAGQVLYEIDAAPFQAAYDTAEAALAKAEANLPAIRSQEARFKEALTEKAVSQQDYDNAFAALKQIEADIQSCKAMVETARINLAYCSITAPISGRIGTSNVTEGAIVTAYQPKTLATIQQLDPIYVDVPQSTTELLRLKRRLADGRLNLNGADHNEVTLVLEDDSAYVERGRLQFSDVTVDPTTGSVNLRVVVSNPDGVLLPGMFVRARVQEGVNEKAILVPQEGVSRDRKGNPFALTVNDENKVGMNPLVLDRVVGDQWLVTDGLAPGDRVIVAGHQMLRPGTSVKVTPEDSSQAKTEEGERDGAQHRERTDGGA